MAAAAKAHANQVIAEHARIAQSANRLRASMRTSQGQNAQRRRTTPPQNRNNRPRSGASDAAFVQAMQSIGDIASAVSLGLATRKVIEFADAWTNLANKLKALDVPANRVAATQSEIIDISNRARASVDGIADSYTRMLLATKDVGATQNQVARATETVAKAMQISGATTAEANGAIVQLGQALASGTLNGDELRSIREQAPLIAQAIAKEFGVTVGQLKKLGEEGKLTVDRVFGAILSASKEVDDKFSKTRATVAQSVSILRNNFIQLVGTINEAYGVSYRLADGIIAIADALKAPGPVLKGLTATVGTLVAALTALVGVRLGAMVGGWVLAIGRLHPTIAALSIVISALVGYLTATNSNMVTFGNTTVSQGAIIQSVWENIHSKVKAVFEAMDHGITGMISDATKIMELINEISKPWRAEDGSTVAQNLRKSATETGLLSKDKSSWGNKLWDWAIGEMKKGGEEYNGIFADIIKRAEQIEKSRQRQRRAYETNIGDKDKSDPLDTSNLIKPADLEAAAKAARDLQRDIDKANSSLRNLQFDLHQERVTFGLRGDELDRMVKLIEFQKQLAGLENLSAKQRQDYLERFDKKLIEHYRLMAKAKTVNAGFIIGAKSYAESAGNAFENAKSLMEGSLSSLEDGLVSLFSTGKMGWKDMIQSMIADFMRLMVIRPLLAKFSAATAAFFSPSVQPVAKSDPWTGLRSIQDFATGFTKASKSIVAANQNAIIAANQNGASAALEKLAAVRGSAGTGQGLLFGGKFKEGVDPKLMAILNETAKRSALQVTAISGLRPGDKRYHGKGMAADIRLADPSSGKVYQNYQNGQDFRVYEQFAQQARQVQMEMYPELEKKFRWGGYFSGQKGKYGALDSMHFDTAGAGMGGGSWADGLTKQQLAYFPNAKSVGMGAAANGLDTTAFTSSVKVAQNSVNQLATNVQAAGSSLSRAGNDAQQAQAGLAPLGNNLQKASLTAQTTATQFTAVEGSVRQAGQAAANAGPQFQQAGATLQSAGGSAGGSVPQVQTIGEKFSELGSSLGGLGGIFQQLFGALGSILGLGGKGGGILSMITSLFTFHKGGIVGKGSGSVRSVAKATKWANDNTFHEGGIVGRLKKGERQILAKDDEAVMPTVRMPDGTFGIRASLGGGGGGGQAVFAPSLSINVEGGSRGKEADTEMANNLAKQLNATLDAKMAEFTIKHSRNGGMLKQGKFR